MPQPVATLQSGHNFATLPDPLVQRSAFDRSNRVGTTFDEGYLVPVWRTLAFPGDTLAVNPAVLARITTLLRPIMDRMFLDLHFWAIPLRLLQKNFVKMMGEQENPGDSIAYTTPQIEWTTTSPVTAGSLYDYLGFPIGVQNVTVAAWSALAYNLTWNTWYRDQNLQDSVYFDDGDGPHDPTEFTLLRRGRRHDYFTSSLPFPQKGNAVTIPIGLSAPIMGLGDLDIAGGTFDTVRVNEPTPYGGVLQGTNTGANVTVNPAPGSAGPWDIVVQYPGWPAAGAGAGLVQPGTMYADLSGSSAISVNDLRFAFALQQSREISARGGTRFPEMIRANFGVISPDARLQRPEFLGGGSVPLNVRQVEQTAPVSGSGVGNLAAYGYMSHDGRGLGFTQSFTEHCIVLGIISTRVDYTYSQGIRREDRYLTADDYYRPVFANLGEQIVRKQEIFAQGGAVDDEGWAWQERWAEMRYMPSELTGNMRPSASGTANLGDIWTVAQRFSALPDLDDVFIVENAPIDRVVATPSEPHFVLDAHFKTRHVRVMPLYSVPGLTRM